MRLIKYMYFLTIFIFTFSTVYGSEVHTEETPPQISAESAILIDATNKSILYEHNSGTKRYPASITKLMTALLAIENLDRNDTLTFSKEAIFGIEPGSSHIGMDVGEIISINDALHGLLLMSANEVANGLAEATSGSIEEFALKMTSRAKELGAKNTNFVNPHGLHNDNHYTTAYDMALIASELVTNDYFLEIMQDPTYIIDKTNITDEVRHLSQDHKMFNPHKGSSTLRDDVIGGKTGFTDQAGHTLVTMARQGDTILIVVLLQGSRETNYDETYKLLEYGFNYYHTISLNHPSETLKTLPIYTVESGLPYHTGNCGISVSQKSNITVPNDITSEDITINVKLPEYIDSTYNNGDSIGEISYMNGSKILAKDELIINQIDKFSVPAPIPKIEKENQPIKLSQTDTLILLVTIVVIIITILIFARRRIKRHRNQLKLKKMFK